ncbi:MAG: triphosphoribosyl-dephospho-CoA synthase [Planctomycetia bacterium]|nr:triphosphoribosyl-dephospho-CoA synthase [Planctomycetia bacterium]
MPDAHSPGSLAQVACLLEATARKPGNVHRFLDFSDSHYLDFGLSALAIGPALDLARANGVGVAVLAAVRATRSVVATNTNLGMILLLAPLAAVLEGEPLASGVERVLASTTVDDARRVFEAIRLAKPGGLGSVPQQDLATEPTVTLRAAMGLAAARDSVARQYVNGFADVLDLAVPCLSDALARGRDLETAIVSAYLGALAALPDTLIARKRGSAESAEASQRAAEVLDAGWPDRKEGRRRFEEFDRWLRADGHARNPGTTADLIASALFVALRAGLIRLPIEKATWGGPTDFA